MIEKTRKLGVNNIFITTLGYSAYKGSSYKEETRLEYNEQLRKVATEYGCGIVPLDDYITDLSYSFYLGDNLHYNAKGATLLSKIYEKSIKEYFNIEYNEKIEVEEKIPLPEGVVGKVTVSNNTNFWGNYANHIFLFKAGSVTKALYSFRVSIDRQEDGSFVVSKIGVSGDNVYDYSGDYVLMISDSYGKVAETAAFKEAIQVGDIVNFVGDPATGNATIQLMKVYTKISADTMGDLSLTALYAELKDNYALSYELNGGKLSENAPSEYLCSTGLKLEMTAAKAGYKFVGWSLSKGGAVVAEIPQGTRGDITLYAVYEAETYKIEYTSDVADIIEIYSASCLQSIGDLSACYLINGDFANAKKIRELILGSGITGYNNTNSMTLGLGSNEDKHEQIMMFSKTVSSLQNKARELKYRDRLENMEKRTMMMLFVTGGGVLLVLFLSMTIMMGI